MARNFRLNESRMKRVVNDVVSETLSEMARQNAIRNRIESIVSETVQEMARRHSINEAEGSKKGKGDADMKRKAVMKMLKDDKYNHAELARKLWHPRDKSEEDTYRSLFSKKATGNPDADGVVRHFSDGEINKLYELLRTR